MAADAPASQTPGAIDGSERKFSSEERRIADVLAAEGKNVKALKESSTGRTADASVDGLRVEFKTLDPGATNGTVKNKISESIKRGGQARDIIEV